MSLAYLADIFSNVNDLNSSIQGTVTNMTIASERISAFTNRK